MANDKPNDQRSTDTDDIMHGRSLAGAEYGANQLEQTAERQRVARGGVRDDEIGESEVTEAEIEAREENRADSSDRNDSRDRNSR